MVASVQLTFLSPVKFMSEYYKIFEKIECISTRWYCVHGTPYCFSGFFRNWDRRRTSTPCAFHLTQKWRQIPISAVEAEAYASGWRNYVSLYMWGMKIQAWHCLLAVKDVDWGEQVENKERHFKEVAKGKYTRTLVCLTMKTTELNHFMLHFI